jgi:hypothetical protein
MTTKRPVDITHAKPGTGDALVRRIYSETRHYPYGEPAKSPARPPDNFRYREQGQHKDRQPSAPQFIEDGRSPNYTNDTSGWVRASPDGKNPNTSDRETAEAKPSFDHSRNRPSMKANKGNTWSKR